MEDTHIIREAQQIKLLADRIMKIIESDNNKTKLHSGLNQEIENIDQLNNTVRNFLEVVSSRKTITSEFLTKIHHDLRTPLVPILAYTDMLLDSKHGSISDEQRKRLEIINSSTKELVQTIRSLFNEKTFDVTSDKPEAGKDHKINELGQEKKILDRINTAFSDELEKTKKENVELKKDLKGSYHKIKEITQVFEIEKSLSQNPNIIDILLSRKEADMIVDSATLIKNVQNRINNASENGYEYTRAIDSSKKFPKEKLGKEHKALLSKFKEKKSTTSPPFKKDIPLVHCTKCGQGVSSDNRFCTICGTPISK